MTFKELAQYFDKIEATASRLAITGLLAQLFQKLTADEIEKTIYLLQGRLAPLFEKIELGMAEKMVIRSASLALDIDKKLFMTRFKKIGDLGKTVEEFKKEKPSLHQQPFSVLEVYERLLRLASAAGEGSQETKINILRELIQKLDPLSCRYLVRVPLGIMRLGFSDMTILDGLSWMLKDNKSLRPTIEKAYHVRPDLGYIAGIIKEKGIKGLSDIKPKLFTPILMMRAERLSSGGEIIKKIGRCAIQNKYDGFRLQVHYQNSKVNGQKQKEVKLYSRNLEDVTFMYPDIVAGIKKEISAREIIFEGEAIGFNPQTNEFLPFQETVQRKRKYEITKKAKEIPLKLFVFELLYFNGISYLQTAYEKRRQQLMKIIKSADNLVKGVIFIADEQIVDNEKKIELLFDEAISKGLEGIIAKKLDGVYQPGARGWNWIKFKRSYSSKINDTVDCLVMGYDFGKGKRTQFGIGAFLVGVYDEKKDQFVTMAKIGTGLSDEEWRQLKTRSQKFKVENKPKNYLVDKAMESDVWLAPKIVVEIKADEITRSPVHTAGRRLKPSKSGSALEVDIPGFALRFPRLERFREDKRPEEATSLTEIQKMFKQQLKKD